VHVSLASAHQSATAPSCKTLQAMLLRAFTTGNRCVAKLLYRIQDEFCLIKLTADKKNSKMKTFKLLFLAFLSLTTMLTGCNKDDVNCSYNTEFCSFISSEEYNETGTYIDKYLSGLKTNLSDEDKLQKLKDWLECKSCVEIVEILCVSCIYTNPPQSELRVTFIVNGQKIEKILDIIMDDPLRFRTYHD
jgi:hypothetical protein